MKFIRLRIANYRGVRQADLPFGSAGITLVQGPNEAGKTSLGEAIGLLFEYLDSSRHRDIEAIKPVHRDEGPEIELQAESGPYAFTYFKRFLKKPETRLTVTRPRPESVTGRPAHERVAEILRETLDVDLWKALILQQGDAIRQPDLTRQTSLSAALDRSAGGRPADPAEEGLFEKVRAEYSRYFTDRGSERKEIAESSKAREAAADEVVRLEKALADLERDVERAAFLQRQLEQLKRQEEQQSKALAACSASLEELAALESAVHEARWKRESAQKSEQGCCRDVLDRQGLRDKVEKIARTHADTGEAAGELARDLTRAESRRLEAQAAFQESDRARKESAERAALRRADFDYYTNQLHLDQLRERKERIDLARKMAARAEEILAGRKLNARLFESIQESEREVLAAIAQMQVGAPSVRLRGLAKCALTVDHTETVLAPGEIRDIPVAETVRLGLAGLLEVEIAAGAGAEGLARKVEEARAALEKVCRKAGVAGPEEARLAWEEMREAMRHRDSGSQVEKENLRDLTYEVLDRKLCGLAESVSGYLNRRAAEPPISPDLTSARKEWERNEQAQEEALRRWETAREEWETARTLRDQLGRRHHERQVQLEMLDRSLQMESRNLEAARAATSDAALSAAREQARQEAAVREKEWQEAEAALRGKNPDRVRDLAEAARGSLQTTQARRGAAQTELTEVRTRLKILGEEGLQEQLHAARSRQERTAAAHASLMQRAAAARLLFETMREERDRVRRAYVAPLQEKIEYLGRLVFDETFRVSLSEDLRIVSRTVGDVTVPFDGLSGGTREQLSLIFRSACCMIVGREEGIPLLLDDTLGYTDPERLRLMGAVLARAARECQIVIFTCVPERFADVGLATVTALR